MRPSRARGNGYDAPVKERSILFFQLLDLGLCGVAFFRRLVTGTSPRLVGKCVVRIGLGELGLCGFGARIVSPRLCPGRCQLLAEPLDFGLGGGE